MCSRFPSFSKNWIVTDKNINRFKLIDKAHLLLNQQGLDIVKGMIRTIADDTILSSESSFGDNA